MSITFAPCGKCSLIWMPVTFVLMGAFFLSSGVLSVNLFFLLKANIGLFINYGWMVVDDGDFGAFVQEGEFA